VLARYPTIEEQFQMSDEQPEIKVERVGPSPGGDQDTSGGLDLPVEPGTTDLGDDVSRTETNRDSQLRGDPSAGLEGGLDPGNNDLGDDVYRTATNRDSNIMNETTQGSGGIMDAGNTDLGPDVYRNAAEG
jgi:hypothetical protein